MADPEVFPSNTGSDGRRWTMDECVRITEDVSDLYCIIKGDGAEDVGFAYIDSLKLSGGAREITRKVITSAPRLDMRVLLQSSSVPFAPGSEGANMGKSNGAFAQRLYEVASNLYHRFEMTGNLSHLDYSLRTLHWAMDMIPHDGKFGELHIKLFNMIGSTAVLKFYHTGCVSDLDDGISIIQELMSLCEGKHYELKTLLFHLGGALSLRFRRVGRPSDIAGSISACRRAVDMTGEGDPNFSVMLRQLGEAYRSRYEHTGELTDIAESISTLRKAVEFAQENTFSLPGSLSALGMSMLRRFERTRNTNDIGEAIDVHRRSAELTPEGHKDLPVVLCLLGDALRIRSEHTGSLVDLTEGISALRRAIYALPDDDARGSILHSSLGSLLQSRFRECGSLHDIDEAIVTQQRAVDITSEGDLALPNHCMNLGLMLRDRFSLTGSLCDISEAISALQKGVRLTPEGHAELPRRLRNLGDSFHWRYSSTRDMDDFTNGIVNLRRASNCGYGNIRIRLKAAKSWALAVESVGDQSQVVPAFDTATRLAAMAAGLGETIAVRHAQLEDFSGVPLMAAAYAFKFGLHTKAVEWLEHGRCLVWGQMSNLRTPVDELGDYDSKLAERVRSVSKSIDTASSTRKAIDPRMTTVQKRLVEEEASTHASHAKEWDELLETVREIPGFEQFLQPLSCEAILKYLPSEGPIVVINVAERCCDAVALIAGLDEPFHIHLPDFSLKKANQYRTDLKSQLVENGFRMRGEVRPVGLYRKHLGKSGSSLHRILSSLWKEVVKPILHALGFTRVDPSSGSPNQRIWWCATGPLSFLPLHAAGCYGGTQSESTLDYAVSSYTPTVTALSERVRNGHPVGASVSGLFITSQPDAVPSSRIPGTTSEVHSICKLASNREMRLLHLDGDDVSVEGCIDNMEKFSSIHLACHASQNAAHPLESRFLLHRGSLDLATIIQRDLKNADLAFLSACQTSTGDEILSDEAVHLAAGMLAAGYQRVVGTMWAIGDTQATQIARDFYQYLWNQPDGDCGGFDGSQSAYALHHAVQQSRRRLDSSEESLLSWVPFVHFGY